MSEQTGVPLEAGWHRVYLALGSNLGERDANLKAALNALQPDVCIGHVSSVYDTAPQLAWINRASTTSPARAHPARPVRAAGAGQAHRARVGRKSGPRYGPRLIDIDLLLYDDLVIDTAELTVPHPRMAGARSSSFHSPRSLLICVTPCSMPP